MIHVRLVLKAASPLRVQIPSRFPIQNRRISDPPSRLLAARSAATDQAAALQVFSAQNCRLSGPPRRPRAAPPMALLTSTATGQLFFDSELSHQRPAWQSTGGAVWAGCRLAALFLLNTAA